MLGLAVVLALAALAGAQEAAGPSSATQPATQPTTAPVALLQTRAPDPDAVRQAIDRLAAAEDLDDSTRQAATAAYNEALTLLQNRLDRAAEAAKFESAQQAAPDRLAALRSQLQQEDPATRPAVRPEETSLQELQDRLEKVEAELAEQRDNLEGLKSEPGRRSQRRLEIPTRLAELRQQLREVQDALAAPPAADVAAELRAARRTRAHAREAALKAEIEALEAELAAYAAEREVLTAGQDLAARRVAHLRDTRQALADAIEKLKAAEAQRVIQEARQARQRAAESHTAVARLAQRNEQLARQSPELIARIADVVDRKEQVTERLGDLKTDFSSLKEKEKVVGDTATFGLLLRKQRSELPDVHAYRERASVRRRRIAEAQLALLELQDRREELGDIQNAVDEHLAAADPPVPAREWDALAEEAEKLLTDRRELLDTLIEDYNRHFNHLVELDVAAQELVALTDTEAEYIDERVLWIRSAGVLSPADTVTAGTALHWLLAPETYALLAGAVWQDLRASPALWAVATIIVVGILGFRWRTARQLAELAEVTTASYHVPLLAIGLTVLLAIPIPAALWFLAWRFSAAPEEALQLRSVSWGLFSAGGSVLTIALLLAMTRTHGLAGAHFAWRPATLRAARRWLWPLLVIVSIAAFCVGAMQAQNEEAWRNALGRLALIVALAAVTVALFRLMRPDGPLFAQAALASGSDRLWRMRHLLWILAWAAPLTLLVLAVAGFYYTALHLTGGAVETLWLLVGYFLVQGMVSRWIDLAQRKLAMRRMRQHAEQQRAAAEQAPAGATPSPATPAGGESATATAPAGAEPTLTQDPRQQVQVITRQSRQMINVVLAVALAVWAWAIWSDSLPALGALDRVQLWSYTQAVSVEGAETNGRGAGVKVVPITLADVSLALVVLVVGILAAKNVPSLLEIAILQRIQFEPGVRYAISTVISYVLAVVGVVVAFNLIGVGWSNVQWLVAAMTVGLGFGLQEIFANFVSGLIILFERPIRLGDTVTIGDMVGTVNRIRIRATTITDWDRKELIVPNREFVTGRLVNWSLSDKVLRVILKVGVAYGSDTAKAEKLLYEAAAECDAVLEDPPPVVLFTAFGDNALQFELRVYIAGIEHYLKTWHGLNMAIDRKFREAGIAIAFPQRDTHLDTLKPLDIRILPPETPDEKPDRQ